MPRFIAITSRGLGEVLKNEVKSLGFRLLPEKQQGAVAFETNWEGCYKANMSLRTATRVLKPILSFPAYQYDDLYYNTLKHDFTKYITPRQTLGIRTKVRQSQLNNQKMITLKIKDAIVDQFYKKYGKRPSVDAKYSDLKINVKVVNNQVSMSLDTSGESLSQRSYRLEQNDAPLREHVAAALLKMTGWKGDEPLIDLMSGSGTIPIEAAMMSKGVLPGSLRRGFAFMKWETLKGREWKLEEEREEKATENVSSLILGGEIRGGLIRKAERNALRAQVFKEINFQEQDARTFGQSALIQSYPRMFWKKEGYETLKKGKILVNPPYGARLKYKDLTELYYQFAQQVKKEFPGWELWVLCGDKSLTKHLQLKSSEKYPIWNGDIECRFLKYNLGV